MNARSQPRIEKGADRSAQQQRAFLTFFRGLPDWAVHAINGGPKVVAGRVLEPRLRFIEKSVQRMRREGPIDVGAVRAATCAMTAVMSGKSGDEVTTRPLAVSAGAGRVIPVRTYEPSSARGTGVAIVYAHFGGGVVGDLETSDWFCALLAQRTGAAVFSVDYRLAPEHPFPAGFEDFLAVYRVIRHELRAQWPIVGVCGDSIGGCFAAACTAETVRAGEEAPDFQGLIYPALDLSQPYPSQELFADAFPMTAETAQWFMSTYLPVDADLTHHRVSPGLFPADAARCRTLLAAAGHDVLVDQAISFKDQLAQHGAQVDWLCFDNLCHGFTSMAGVSRRVEHACETIAAGIAEIVTRVSHDKAGRAP